MVHRFHCPTPWLQQSLQGEGYLITGVSRGLGHTLATQLLRQGATVMGISKTPSLIRHPSFVWQPLDLSDLAAVSQFTQHLITEGLPLTGLINNAAVIPTECIHTDEGLELQWTVNYLSAIYLTETLSPLLKIDIPSHIGRVVHVSSSAHHMVHGRLATLHFADPTSRLALTTCGLPMHSPNLR